VKREREPHLRSGLDVADGRAVQARAQPGEDAAVVKGRRPELVEGDGERRERDGRLRDEEPEALGQLGGDQVAGRSRHCRPSPDECTARPRRPWYPRGCRPARPRSPPRNPGPRGVGQGQGIGRADQDARAALIDQRIGLEIGRQLGVARPPHQRAVNTSQTGRASRCGHASRPRNTCGSTSSLSAGRSRRRRIPLVENALPQQDGPDPLRLELTGGRQGWAKANAGTRDVTCSATQVRDPTGRTRRSIKSASPGRRGSAPVRFPSDPQVGVPI
jgi:hypothetical protein